VSNIVWITPTASFDRSLLDTMGWRFVTFCISALEIFLLTYFKKRDIFTKTLPAINGSGIIASRIMQQSLFLVE